jgi:hypothetical protein
MEYNQSSPALLHIFYVKWLIRWAVFRWEEWTPFYSYHPKMRLIKRINTVKWYSIIYYVVSRDYLCSILTVEYNWISLKLAEICNCIIWKLMNLVCIYLKHFEAIIQNQQQVSSMYYNCKRISCENLLIWIKCFFLYSFSFNRWKTEFSIS